MGSLVLMQLLYQTNKKLSFKLINMPIFNSRDPMDVVCTAFSPLCKLPPLSLPPQSVASRSLSVKIELFINHRRNQCLTIVTL